MSDFPEASDRITSAPALPFSCYRNRPKAADWAAFFAVLTALGVWGALHPSPNSRFGIDAVRHSSILLLVVGVSSIALFVGAMLKRAPVLTVIREGLRIRKFPLIAWSEIRDIHIDATRGRFSDSKDVRIVVKDLDRLAAVRLTLSDRALVRTMRLSAEPAIPLGCSFLDTDAETLFAWLTTYWKRSSQL